MIAAGFVLLAIAFAASALRWLRVAQREHYLPGSASRFARRWWSAGGVNALAGVFLLAALGATMVEPVAAAVVVVLVVLAPVGLSLRGRTSALAWTRRLRMLAAGTLLLGATVVVVSGLIGSLQVAFRVASVMVVAVPLLVDVALWAAAPIEHRLGERFVRQAILRLRRVGPRVVAITGSYGKTTTKGYVAHLLAGRHSVVASPRSFNNRAGLARTVNEHLELGTEVLVAEMGTYGPGEIADMCEWVRPEIAVMTAIGPVHLERFKDLSITLAAKSEIAETAHTVVLNVDDERLASLIVPFQARNKRVIRCSATDPSVDVCVRADDGAVAVFRRGELVCRLEDFDDGAHALSNVACALGVVEAIGDSIAEGCARLSSLPQPPHRLGVALSDSGAEILDDTFNSNPAGARRALSLLARRGSPAGRRVLVTPGMIELGPRQTAENRELARLAVELGATVVVVGRTNRAALVAGADGRVSPITVRRREDAVAWVRSHLGPGDVVLYENDLPDHYP